MGIFGRTRHLGALQGQGPLRLDPRDPHARRRRQGLVIGETGKRVLQLAGVSDVLSRTSGQTRTTINYAAATFNALKALNTTRVTQEQRERLHITYGRAI
ncbi:MAG: hypothetical protein CM15mP79_2000 [Methanobacteriota archaeon]|nr:MAG: hypothetical protein CM15mP79_2000 [Euryarchaeota archaeon]